MVDGMYRLNHSDLSVLKNFQRKRGQEGFPGLILTEDDVSLKYPSEVY